MATPVLEMKGISKRFGDVVAVAPTSLTVAKGSFLTILGPSGCGKTTLLHMIAGFLEPTSGEIRLHGRDMRDVPPHRRSIGMVFQKLALFPHMTAAENIAYPLKMRRFTPAEIPSLVEKYLDLVRLGGMGSRRPHELSGGQQQRVAIARALSFSPDLLLLDEPLSALDKKLREEMQLEFRRIQQELGVTAVNVTHDQREALVMSDQIIVMEGGHVQQDDVPRSIYRTPANRFVANFIGLTSIFPAVVVEGSAERHTVRAGDVALTVNTKGVQFAAGTKVDYAVRAEQIRIVGADGAAFDNILDAVVKQRVFEGDRMVYEMVAPALGAASIFVVAHDADAFVEHAPQSTVRVGWNSGDSFLFAAR